MVEKNSIDLDDRPAIAGTRVLDAPCDRVIREYGADKGMVQTRARRVDSVSKMAVRTS